MSVNLINREEQQGNCWKNDEGNVGIDDEAEGYVDCFLSRVCVSLAHPGPVMELSN